MSFACKEVSELIPFMLNGSLGIEEEEVRSHLVACGRCREELAETRQTWLIFDSHIPSMILATYAQGEKLDFGDPEWIEDHLAGCSSCAELVSLVETDGFSEDQTSGSAEPHAPAERRWPLTVGRIAAGLAAVAAFLWVVESPNGVEQSPTTIESISAGSSVGTESALSAQAPFLDGFESGTTLSWSQAENAESEPPEVDI